MMECYIIILLKKLYLGLKMTDIPIKCNKCRKTIFYIPNEYEMNIPIICINCHDGRKPAAPRTATANFAKVRKGKRVDVHPTYSFRSATEANFARILNYLNLEWKFEERVFTFPDRKVRPFMYIMDFEIIKGCSEIKKGFYEIKGYMKAADRQKLRLLKKYYPNEFKETTVVIYNKYRKKDIKFVDQQGYKYLFYDKLTKQYQNLIPNWE